MKPSIFTNFIYIILVGMTGAERTIIGPLLAVSLGLTFPDTHALVAKKYDFTLEQSPYSWHPTLSKSGNKS